ncbi:MAG: putative Fur family transcriptional regulator [Frankiales bacterium]|nr:putative Fur family transcriptional regulator [Frankiales bacterium]
MKSGAESLDWAGELRDCGLRPTRQRQAVLAALVGLRHGTPEEIAAVTKADGVGLSTVYRSLEALSERGLVAHTHFDHGPPTYSLAGEHEHVHLSCHVCGRIDEVPARLLGPVVAALETDYGFRVDMSHFVISGRCTSCEGIPGDRSALPLA